MIALDTSALVAIAAQEEGYVALDDVLLSYPTIVGAPTLLELHQVLRGRGAVDPFSFVARLQTLSSFSVATITSAHFEAARTAFDRFGKGRGHKAGLNFGDCLAYAVAKVAGVPLLFKGDDFLHTDIQPAYQP